MSCEYALNFDQKEKHFPKTISQYEFDCGLFTNLPTIIVACNFSPSSFKLKNGIVSNFIQTQKRYPNSLDKMRILT